LKTNHNCIIILPADLIKNINAFEKYTDFKNAEIGKILNVKNNIMFKLNYDNQISR